MTPTVVDNAFQRAATDQADHKIAIAAFEEVTQASTKPPALQEIGIEDVVRFGK